MAVAVQAATLCTNLLVVPDGLCQHHSAWSVDMWLLLPPQPLNSAVLMLQLLRLEFTEPSETRPPTTFNYNKERQDALNAALLHEAPDPLPPSKQPARQVVLVEEANPSDGEQCYVA